MGRSKRSCSVVVGGSGGGNICSWEGKSAGNVWNQPTHRQLPDIVIKVRWNHYKTNILTLVQNFKKPN